MSNIKGYAVLRTAENAKEVNEWMNRKTALEPTGIYNMSDGYIHITAHNTFCVWAHIKPNYELCPDFTTFKERVEAMEKPEENLIKRNLDANAEAIISLSEKLIKKQDEELTSLQSRCKVMEAERLNMMEAVREYLNGESLSLRLGKQFNLEMDEDFVWKLTEVQIWRMCWLIGSMHITNSIFIAKDAGVTQKTAWGFLDTVRRAYKQSILPDLATNGTCISTFRSWWDVLELIMKLKNPISKQQQ